MTTHFINRRSVLVAVLAALPVMSWAVAPAVQAADKAVKTSAPSVSSGGGVASGAVEDSQQACLARIPKDATAGQRLMAEQSCKRDQASRQSIQNVPGR